MSFWVAALVTIAAEFAVLRRLRFDRVLIAIVLLGTLSWLNYLSYTSVSERNYDAASQLEYIGFIAQHGRVPDVFACSVCGHPPLYYALAAAWSKLLPFLGLEFGLQWLSLLLAFGFVVFGLLVFRSRLERRGALWLTAALLVFWPSMIINSVRVHNDALASPLMLAAIYFTAQWDQRDRSRDFYAALAACVLALLTKSSGYAVAATLVFIAALRARSAWPRREDAWRCAAAVVVLAISAVSVVALRDSSEPLSLCQGVVGHACDGRFVPPVPDTPKHFLYFDVPDFVARMDQLSDDPARDYFLNRFVKSSLFGIMPLGAEFESRAQLALATALRVLLLPMMLGGAVALLFTRNARRKPDRVYVVATLLLFLSLLVFRIRVPNLFHEDFRHVFPLLVPLCLGYGKVVERLERLSPALHKLSVAVGISFIAASLAFFFCAHSARHRHDDVRRFAQPPPTRVVVS